MVYQIPLNLTIHWIMCCWWLLMDTFLIVWMISVFCSIILGGIHYQLHKTKRYDSLYIGDYYLQAKYQFVHQCKYQLTAATQPSLASCGWGLYSLYSNILQLSNTLMFSSIKCTFIYVEQLHSRPEALCKVNPLQYQMLQDMKDKKRKYRDQGENKTMGKREKLIHDMQQKQINTPRMKKHEQKCSVHHVKPVVSHGLPH